MPIKITDRNNISRLTESVKQSKDLFFNEAGKQLANEVRNTIMISQDDYTPLHPFTIERKGHEIKLIEKSTLFNSIGAEFDGKILRIGVDSDSKAAIYCKVHEFGAIIYVTNRMRAYLRSIGLYLKDSTTHIVIPRRSYLEKTTKREEVWDSTADLLYEKINEILNNVF